MIVASNRRALATWISPSTLATRRLGAHDQVERALVRTTGPATAAGFGRRYVSINESCLVFDMPTKNTALRFDRHAGSSAIGKMAFARDGHVLSTTDAGSEFRRLARASIDKPAHYEYLTDDLKWDVDDIEVDTTSDKSGRLAFTINEDGASRLFLLDDGKRREIPLPLGIASGLEFSPDAALGFTLARPNGPAEAYSVPVAGGEPTRLDV
jgi:hypothetical protein